jgi:arsenite methyltransferase
VEIGTRTKRRGSYGVDAPNFLLLLGFLIVVDIIAGVLSENTWSFLGAALIVACAAVGLYASRRGKFIVWETLINQLSLKGDERILDLGCGRGAILMIAAKHLTTGKAVGIDIWRRGDQSGNSIEETETNARLEGVADRVEIRTADMTALPFEDNSFDLVVSNLAIHNVKENKRDKAIEEAIRVLRPGGRLMVADIFATDQYVKKLESLAMNDISRRDLGWRMWWTGPWLRTLLVSCTRPLEWAGKENWADGLSSERPENNRKHPYSTIRAISQRAEADGFDSIWVPDHLLYRNVGEPTLGIWECWTILAALAEATKRVEIGTLVVSKFLPQSSDLGENGDNLG